MRAPWSLYARQIVYPPLVLRCGVGIWACWMDSAVLMSSAACGLMGAAYAHNPGCVCRVVLGLLLAPGGACGGCA